jgi:hypothetical protein
VNFTFLENLGEAMECVLGRYFWSTETGTFEKSGLTP